MDLSDLFLLGGAALVVLLIAKNRRPPGPSGSINIPGVGNANFEDGILDVNIK